jgi:hypothetical protein
LANGGKGMAHSLKAGFGFLMCRRELAKRQEESRAQGQTKGVGYDGPVTRNVEGSGHDAS